MRNWIARLFKGADARADDGASAVPVAAAAPSRPAGAATQVDAQLDESRLEQAFWRWLCGLPAGQLPPDPSGAAARLVLDELARLARAPEQAAELVPRVPEVVPQLLRSLRDEAVSGAELARQVTRDAVLVAAVIREANSPVLRASKPVRTVDAALLVLGQNGLRMLLARVAFRPIIGAASGRCARLVAPRLWQHSERCARAASLLAPPLGADPFEAYLAGLMLDVGLIVAFRLVDQLIESGAPPHDPALVPALLAGARTLSARIALHWQLPPPVGAAILGAGRGDAQVQAQPLARALGQADRLAMLRMLVDHAMLAEHDPLLATMDGPAARVFEALAPEPG